MKPSLTLPWPMLSWIACFTMPTASICRAIHSENFVLNPSFRPLDV